MQGFRLNWWQRIGILMSVLWVFFGALVAVGNVFNPVYSRFSVCIKVSRTNEEFVKCPKDFSEGIRAARAAWPQTAALVGLAPIAIAWLCAYALIAIVRWVRAGFSEVGGGLRRRRRTVHTQR
jgi:hypothetical protein